MTSRRTDTRRPECADGCPLTDPSGCATGCIRAPSVPVGQCECGQGPATVAVVPGYLTCQECADLWRARLTLEPTTPVELTAAPVTLEHGHVGTEVTPARAPSSPPPAREDDPVDPFTWTPYLVLAAVILAAVLCALAGWTDPS